MLAPEFKHKYTEEEELSEIERLLFQWPYSFLTWVSWGLFWYVFVCFSLMTGEQLVNSNSTQKKTEQIFCVWFQEKTLVCGLKIGSQVLNGVLLLIWYQEPWVPDQTSNSSPETEEVGSVQTSISKMSWL